MVSHLFFYQLTLIALVWLCVMLQWVWPSDSVAACPTTLAPPPPRPKRRRASKPFAGLTTKPHCDACARATAPRPQAPSPPPPRIVMTRGRRREMTPHPISAPTRTVPIAAGRPPGRAAGALPRAPAPAAGAAPQPATAQCGGDASTPHPDGLVCDPQHRDAGERQGRPHLVVAQDRRGVV